MGRGRHGGRGFLTRAMYLENGTPPSRAKAHSIREAVARIPTQAKNWVMITMQI